MLLFNIMDGYVGAEHKLVETKIVPYESSTQRLDLWKDPERVKTSNREEVFDNEHSYELEDVDEIFTLLVGCIIVGML